MTRFCGMPPSGDALVDDKDRTEEDDANDGQKGKVSITNPERM